MIKLWLDDLRPAPSPEWALATSAEEAINFLSQCLKEGKEVGVAQLDHDLGGEAYNACQICRNELEDYEEWMEVFLHGCEHGAKTGVAVVEWMRENRFWPREIVIHSYNFAGARRMADIAKDYTHVTLRMYNPKDFK